MMEAYYQIVGPENGGLHAMRYDADAEAEGGKKGAFVACTTDEEKNAERDRWMDCLRSILPASFRIDRSLDDCVRSKLLKELGEFVGTEMEIEIEVPNKSAPFGAKKNLMEGTTGNHAAGKVDEDAKADDAKADGDDADVNTDADAGELKILAPASAGTVATTVSTIKKTIAPARPIPYIGTADIATEDGSPAYYAYQLSVDRRTIRRNPALAKFHEWLKIQTDCGHITRQETVSMIPPVVLDSQPGMAVLDMCAAPGSKTCQLIEIASIRSKIKRQRNAEDGEGEGDVEEMEPEPTGYVVANDADHKRAFMLVNQLRRMNSPVFFVTACDGQYFPLLDDKKTERGTENEGTFDRALCDVPCSGDGTVRKNPGIWKRWNQQGSFALHPLQISIALKGALLTKVGGLVVYSTCSMNPIENEAVVAELLRLSEGSLELVDPRGRMEGLVARNGWSSWNVLRESRSKKAMRNMKKKNNPKMLEKRKMWGEKRRIDKRKREREEEGEGKEKEGEATEGEKKESAEEATEGEGANEQMKEEVAEKMETEGGEDAKKDDGGAAIDKDGNIIGDVENVYTPSPFLKLPYVPPTSWDDASLKARSEALGFTFHDSFESVEPDWKRRVRASCFPPTKEEAEKFHLERCLRCLPHDMDTGGFFVALLRKVKPMGRKATEKMNALAKESRGGLDVDASGDKMESKKEEEEAKKEVVVEEGGVDDAKVESADAVMTESTTAVEADPAKAADADDAVKDDTAEKDDTDTKEGTSEEAPAQKAPAGKPNRSQNQRDNRRDQGKADFVPVDPDMWPPVIDHFGLTPDFPKDQFMARATGDPKVVYFLSKSIKTNLIDQDIQKRVTVINSGMKAFERNNKRDCGVRFRVTQEGVHYVLPYITKRVHVAKMDDFVACIASGGIMFDKFTEKFAAELKPLEPGSFVVALEGYEKDWVKKMFLVMWRCRGDALNCLVAKVEMDAILSKLRAVGYVPKEVEVEEKVVETDEKSMEVDEKVVETDEKVEAAGADEKVADAS